MSSPEEAYLSQLRRQIEEQYVDHPTGCGCSFGEILCWEIHSQGLSFQWLSEKWRINLATLGDLISDHCRRLQDTPQVNHGY